jgi:hypothetical protein
MMMTSPQTLTRATLASVAGAARSAQAQAVCNRQQFDWMTAHMVPDSSVRPGVQRHVVAHDAQVCGFPMPR